MGRVGLSPFQGGIDMAILKNLLVLCCIAAGFYSFFNSEQIIYAIGLGLPAEHDPPSMIEIFLWFGMSLGLVLCLYSILFQGLFSWRK